VKILLFRNIIPAFQWPPVTLIVVPKAACDPEIVLREIRPMTAKERRIKFEAAFGTIFKICKCVQRINFSLE
jgi:hypothetical protein